MFWHDLPTQLALLGMTFITPLLMLGLSLYAGHRYTRLPDGRWTTWEKTLLEKSGFEERAA